MAELELTIMSRGPTTGEELGPLLEEFEAENHIRIRLHALEWDQAWADLLKVALYRHGADVSEIGTTWLGSFVGMNALHPFSDQEIESIGGVSAFIPSTWQSGLLAQNPLGRPLTWAIPWWADTRILYYRQDLLAQAGIEEGTAFQTPEDLKQTLQRLQASGVPIPWVVPTHESRMTLHNVASWLWGAGGRFVSGDGTRVQFNWPQARAGIRAYFELAPYLAEPARHLDDTQSDALFHQGRAAATISGPWLVQHASPEVRASLGMTFPPGIPFVGGSHLVCWQHAVYRVAAIKLIRFLTSQRVQAAFGKGAGLLPTRPDVLCNPPFSEEPLYQMVAQGLERGRSFLTMPLWGLVEERLSEALSDLWKAILADPDLDLERALAERLEPLAQRLDVTLGSRR
jgi:multiple sugar transport system substrate-binding protein